MENFSPDSSEPYPLIDAIDHEILMHRDIHFGGQFSVMLEYYEQEGKGIQPEFTLKRIEELAQLEIALQQDLAALFLSGHEVQQVADSREAYRQLRAVYTIKNPKSSHPRLLADLILAEEEEPEKEIQAIVSEKGSMVPILIDFISKDEFYKSTFPGYGQAPILAAKCLGLIGDKRAIIALFEAINQTDFFSDEQILKALKAIGNPAKEFLLKVIKGRPLNEDNEKAAIALIEFREDPEVALMGFELLQQEDVQKDPCLSTYLALICAGLKDLPQREAFIQWSQQAKLPAVLREDIKALIHEWENSQDV